MLNNHRAQKLLAGLAVSYAVLAASQCLSQTVTVKGNIPYASNLLGSRGVLDVWSMARVREDKDYTVNPGGTTTMEKDSRSRAALLGFQSKMVEKGHRFSGTLDMTGAAMPATVAILVDDNATLTVAEIERSPSVSGPAFSQTYTVNGTALWNPKSYVEFPAQIPPGRKYQLDLVYNNTANLTKRYKGAIDVDGVSVYLCLVPVRVSEVSFQQSLLKSDDDKTTYKAPQWLDKNGDGGSVNLFL